MAARVQIPASPLKALQINVCRVFSFLTVNQSLRRFCHFLPRFSRVFQSTTGTLPAMPVPAYLLLPAHYRHYYRHTTGTTTGSTTGTDGVYCSTNIRLIRVGIPIQHPGGRPPHHLLNCLRRNSFRDSRGCCRFPWRTESNIHYPYILC